MKNFSIIFFFFDKKKKDFNKKVIKYKTFFRGKIKLWGKQKIFWEKKKSREKDIERKKYWEKKDIERKRYWEKKNIYSTKKSILKKTETWKKLKVWLKLFFLGNLICWTLGDCTESHVLYLSFSILSQ